MSLSLYSKSVNQSASLSTGLEAALVLTQPTSISVNLGENMKISCSESGGRESWYSLSWYQQKPGGVPKFLIETDQSRPSGLPARFSYSGSKMDKTEYLLINGFQAEDSAMYYCACDGCSSDHSDAVH